MVDYINSLIDDPLLKIFGYLSFSERIHNEVVCKRWMDLLRCTFNTTTILNVAEFMKTTYRTHYQQDNVSFAPTVTGLLTRVGPWVREISFGAKWLKISQQIIDTISEHCVRLTRLDLGCTIMNANISSAVERLAENLTDFSLGETHFIRVEDSQDIHLLFPLMSNLRRLNLRHAPFPLTSLPQLSTGLQHVNLNGARGLTLPVLQDFLLSHPNLRELRLSSQQRVDQTCIEIMSNLTHLQILELSNNQVELDLGPFIELTNLEELHLQYTTSLEDISFRAICSQLGKLRHINVTGCKRIRDYSPLLECRNLEKFYGGHTVQICDEDLAFLGQNYKLRSLTLVHCHNVTTLGVLEIARCPLVEISVQYCPEVTDAALIALVSRQKAIPSISLQGCRLTTEGVRALAQLDTLPQLQELDISYNRAVGEEAIFAIREALACFYKYEPAPQRPTIYTHLTAVSKVTTSLVQDYINLIF